MKTILVFVALLSLAMAQYDMDESDYRRALLLQRLRELQERANLRQQPSPLESSRAAVMATLKKTCDENGEPGAYQEVERALEDFSGCVERVMRDTPKPAYSGVSENVNYGCRLAPQWRDCVMDLAGSVKPCLPPSRQSNVELLGNATSTLVSYLCDNNGARVKALLYEGGAECFLSRKVQVQQCFVDAKTDELANSIESALSSGEMQEAECKKTSELRQCMDTNLRSCPNPATANFFTGLIDAVQKFSPCQNELEGVAPLK